MNYVLFAITGLCAALYAAAAAWTLLAEGIARRKTADRNRLQDEYLSILAGRMSKNERSDSRGIFPRSRSGEGKMLLAETIASLSALDCGFDFTLKRKIVADNDIDRFLYSRIVRSRSWKRIRFMQLLSQCGAREELLPKIRRFENSDDPYTALFALLIRTGSAPDETVRSIREFEGPLSERAWPEIMLQLRRGLIPVAYEPMLRSGNENLEMLGIYIIRCFGIRQAEELLLAMLDDGSPTVQDAALYALASMKSSMAHRSVVECVSAMSFFQRRKFYKYLVAEGYSAVSLSALQKAEKDSRLGGYMESQVNSYKKMLQ